jgi:predicted nucleotidyltransferase
MRFPVSRRVHLLNGVRKFVLEAVECPGVHRIAIVGSLTTDKQDPNDADVLVTVSAGAELSKLARAARRLKGHAQQINCGADIFLVDPAEVYIGRICHWKDCRPGVRQSCDALHCGRRPFLHDDVQVVNLDPDLVNNPPVVVWPSIIRNQSVPDDVESIVLTFL